MNFFYNIGYFLKEVKRIFKMNLLSNILSLLGTGLLLFLFGLVISGWNVSNRIVETLQGEAEISVYFDEAIDTNQAENIVKYINTIDGVWNARLVNETEAYDRMKNILGEEADILELFDENPFEAYSEVRIHLDEMDTVLDKLSNVEGVSYVRDNRQVLDQVKNITDVMKVIGYFVIVAVGITTLVLISHLIRQGIYNNKEQINTLRLLGAPDTFIGLPFLLTGLILTLAGGILATILIVILIHMGYNQLADSIPFIPLPSRNQLIITVSILIPATSIILGLMGSLFGLSKER